MNLSFQVICSSILLDSRPAGSPIELKSWAGMAAMTCAAAAAGIGSLPPCGTSKRNSQKRMQVVMLRSNPGRSNRLSLLQALSQQAAAQSQRCKHLYCPCTHMCILKWIQTDFEFDWFLFLCSSSEFGHGSGEICKSSKASDRGTKPGGGSDEWWVRHFTIFSQHIFLVVDYMPNAFASTPIRTKDFIDHVLENII